MDANPIDRAAALALVAGVEQAFGTHDIDRIMPGFSDDITVRFADQPEIHGHAAVRAFLEARLARQKAYTLTRTNRMVDGNMIGNYRVDDWEDAFTGKRMSGQAFGHLGFTGTSIWCDPKRDVCVVLLTNRVHPTRNNTKIRGFRPAFHDSVLHLLDGD